MTFVKFTPFEFPVVWNVRHLNFPLSENFLPFKFPPILKFWNLNFQPFVFCCHLNSHLFDFITVSTTGIFPPYEFLPPSEFPDIWISLYVSDPTYEFLSMWIYRNMNFLPFEFPTILNFCDLTFQPFAFLVIKIPIYLALSTFLCTLPLHSLQINFPAKWISPHVNVPTYEFPTMWISPHMNIPPREFPPKWISRDMNLLAYEFHGKWISRKLISSHLNFPPLPAVLNCPLPAGLRWAVSFPPPFCWQSLGYPAGKDYTMKPLQMKTHSQITGASILLVHCVIYVFILHFSSVLQEIFHEIVIEEILQNSSFFTYSCNIFIFLRQRDFYQIVRWYMRKYCKIQFFFTYICNIFISLRQHNNPTIITYRKKNTIDNLWLCFFTVVHSDLKTISRNCLFY